MAIIFLGKSDCALCKRVLAASDQIAMFPPFIADTTHPLRHFSDSAMHQECFDAWEHRSEFVAAYNSLWTKAVPNHPRVMLPNGSIVNADKGPSSSD